MRPPPVRCKFIFEMVEEAADVTIPTNTDKRNAEFRCWSLEKSMFYLRMRISYIFENPRARPETEEISINMV